MLCCLPGERFGHGSVHVSLRWVKILPTYYICLLQQVAKCNLDTVMLYVFITLYKSLVQPACQCCLGSHPLYWTSFVGIKMYWLATCRVLSTPFTIFLSCPLKCQTEQFIDGIDIFCVTCLKLNFLLSTTQCCWEEWHQ